MKPSERSRQAAREVLCAINLIEPICGCCSYGATEKGRYVHKLCSGCMEKSERIARSFDAARAEAAEECITDMSRLTIKMGGTDAGIFTLAACQRACRAVARRYRGEG